MLLIFAVSIKDAMMPQARPPVNGGSNIPKSGAVKFPSWRFSYDEPIRCRQFSPLAVGRAVSVAAAG